jgi:predicted RNase H-like HicB family nuclease
MTKLVEYVSNNIRYWVEDNIYVIQDIALDVTTQGETLKEAQDNLKEAVWLYELCRD